MGVDSERQEGVCQQRRHTASGAGAVGSTLQHAAPRCNARQPLLQCEIIMMMISPALHCNTRHHSATYGTTLHHTLQHTLQHTLEYTVLHTLQHTLQHQQPTIGTILHHTLQHTLHRTLQHQLQHTHSTLQHTLKISTTIVHIYMYIYTYIYEYRKYTNICTYM